MKFAIFLPSIVEKDPTVRLPVVYFLSGLTCNEQNMITKSGFQRYAEQYKLVVVCPDTSPRNCNVPGENDQWDLGTGAGFYVDATQDPWSKHYRMYSYVTKEIREVVDKNFPNVDSNKVGVTGHSMGGHGALITFLRNPQVYKAVTAFAPISNPLKSDWGVKCLSTYLGPDESKWLEYDATELVKLQPQRTVKIIVDQGSKDKYMTSLVPDNFIKACREAGQPVEYNLREGYDHGYFFVGTFIENHLKHFAETLKSVHIAS